MFRGQARDPEVSAISLLADPGLFKGIHKEKQCHHRGRGKGRRGKGEGEGGALYAFPIGACLPTLIEKNAPIK